MRRKQRRGRAQWVLSSAEADLGTELEDRDAEAGKAQLPWEEAMAPGTQKKGETLIDIA